MFTFYRGCAGVLGVHEMYIFLVDQSDFCKKTTTPYFIYLLQYSLALLMSAFSSDGILMHDYVKFSVVVIVCYLNTSSLISFCALCIRCWCWVDICCACSWTFLWIILWCHKDLACISEGLLLEQMEFGALNAIAVHFCANHLGTLLVWPFPGAFSGRWILALSLSLLWEGRKSSNPKKIKSLCNRCSQLWKYLAFL